jgi:hypothetical protein
VGAVPSEVDDREGDGLRVVGRAEGMGDEGMGDERGVLVDEHVVEDDVHVFEEDVIDA